MLRKRGERMKKLISVLLVLVAVLAMVFAARGFHHAFAAAALVEDWLSADNGDQSVTVTVNGMTLEGNTFWTDQSGRRVFGLETGGFPVWLRENVLYFDGGTAYSLPELSVDQDQVRQLVTAFLLYGQITKEDGTCHLALDVEGLSLRASVTGEETLSRITLDAAFSYENAPVVLHAACSVRPTEEHPIPGSVTDAMVRADMAPPMSLREPLEALLPALSDLDPLTANVTFAVDCGILTLSEDAVLTWSGGELSLDRSGSSVPLALPEDLSPAALGLLMLRDGEFVQTGDADVFRITLSGDVTKEICAALVPQISDFSIDYAESTLELTIRQEQIDTLTMTAGGSIPFLVADIPISITITCIIT